MALQVAIITRETIKPSCPIPPHDTKFKLSLIDQYIPPIPASLILFYPAKENDAKFDNSKAFDHLKTSLSETLTRFYPLGGRVMETDSQHLDCNDVRVEYVETQVRARLKEVISNPKDEDMNELTPVMGWQQLLAIQVNKFECGGIAITLSVSHKIVDGATMGTFLSSWAKTACGSSEKTVFPTFDASTIFPPQEVASLELPDGMEMKKLVNKRFIFKASKISALKAKAANTSYVVNPTRVEAIVALIWRCAWNASRDRIGFLKPSLVNLVLNFRGIMKPPLPDHSFGNLVMGAITSSTSENETDLHCLVAKLREAKRKLDEDYFKKLPVNDVLAMGHESMIDAHMKYAKGEVDFYTFTSLCRFPLYEADFGWGKPIWVNCLGTPFTNIVTLMNAINGDGVEAWVCLDEQEMVRFERDEELLAYASPVFGISSKL